MCKIMEDMRNEAAREAAKEAAKEAAINNAKETAVRMIKKGKMPLEDIADYTELPLDTIKELAGQQMKLA